MLVGKAGSFLKRGLLERNLTRVSFGLTLSQTRLERPARTNNLTYLEQWQTMDVKSFITSCLERLWLKRDKNYVVHTLDFEDHFWENPHQTFSAVVDAHA
jgi:hypothetical protein